MGVQLVIACDSESEKWRRSLEVGDAVAVLTVGYSNALSASKHTVKTVHKLVVVLDNGLKFRLDTGGRSPRGERWGPRPEIVRPDDTRVVAVRLAAQLRMRRQELAKAAAACEDPEMLLSAQTLLGGEVGR